MQRNLVMPRRTASPAIGLIRALIATGIHTQAARSLTHPPSHTPAPPKQPRRRQPANSTSSIEQAPPPPLPRPFP